MQQEGGGEKREHKESQGANSEKRSQNGDRFRDIHQSCVLPLQKMWSAVSLCATLKEKCHILRKSNCNNTVLYGRHGHLCFFFIKKETVSNKH